MTNELDRKDEYRECLENWRFLVGLRFTIVGFYLTFLVALLSILCSHPVKDNNLIKMFISLVGAISSFLILFLQIRTRQLYTLCTDRAKEIEQNDSSNKRLMELLDQNEIPAQRPLYGKHTLGLYGLHGLGITIWTILFFYYCDQICRGF